MTPENFVYWMQGMFEVAGVKSFNEEQTKIIKDHLAMVFVHSIDPNLGDEEHRKKLDEIHNGPTDEEKELKKAAQKLIEDLKDANKELRPRSGRGSSRLDPHTTKIMC